MTTAPFLTLVEYQYIYFKLQCGLTFIGANN